MFPFGLSPEFGIELSSSVVYSDSNPLLALLFKPFSSFLPDVFQYFGWWLLACFVLQAWFGWRLLGFISNNGIIRLLGAGFFIFSPPMIFRAAMHLSLGGHFLVLAALYLALKKESFRPGLLWGTLLSASALVHAYLLAMVAFIWLADLLRRLVIETWPMSRAVREVVIMTVLLGLVCWLAGYFSVGQGVVSGGYGYLRMNLLSVLDANEWSFALKDIPEGKGDYEGFNFLGLGIIVLALLSMPVLITGHVGLLSVIKKQAILLFSLLGLTLFALSNDIGIASSELQYPLPEFVLQVANIFRASGRMFWPVFYMLVFVVLFVIIRGHTERLAIFLLAGALVIQILDTRAGWGDIRANLMVRPASEWRSPLKDPFWGDAARQYKKIRWIKPINQSPNWQVLAAFAAKHNLATDAVYLARINHSSLMNTQRRALNLLHTGHYEADTLYVLDEASLRLAALSLNSERDLLAQVDGLFVVAPGWKECGVCVKGQDEVNVSDLSSIVYLGKDLPSTTGGLNGSSRFAKAGLDQAGYITYGPYIYLAKGKYEVSIKYASSALTDFKVGRYDVYDADRQYKYSEGILSGTGGKEKTLTAHFEINGQTLSQYEFRVFWDGVADLEVKEVQLRSY